MSENIDEALEKLMKDLKRIEGKKKQQKEKMIDSIIRWHWKRKKGQK